MPEIRQKVYNPDKDNSYTKTKAAKCRRNAGNSGFTGADPTEDCAFKEDFSVLPVFVPTDTLVILLVRQLLRCRARKGYDYCHLYMTCKFPNQLTTISFTYELCARHLIKKCKL